MRSVKKIKNVATASRLLRYASSSECKIPRNAQGLVYTNSKPEDPKRAAARSFFSNCAWLVYTGRRSVLKQVAAAAEQTERA